MLSDEVKNALDAVAHAGRLTPNDVIEAARSDASPLHDYFTWDDRKAAALCRVDEARRLITSYRFTVQSENRLSPTYIVPAFVRDPTRDPGEQGYVSLRRLRLPSEDDNRRATIVHEFAAVAAALRRARGIAAYLNEDVASRVDALLTTIDEMRGIFISADADAPIT